MNLPPPSSPTLSCRAVSRITAEPTAEGITISIPPAPLWHALLACAFVLLMLAPMTIGMVVSVLHYDDEDFAKYELYYVIGICLILLFFWSALGFIIWKILRRRHVPTILNLTASQLTVVTPDLPKLRHDYHLDNTFSIESRRIGIGINLRATGVLRIRQNGRSLKILPGRDLREIQWVVNALNEAIAARSGQ